MLAIFSGLRTADPLAACLPAARVDECKRGSREPGGTLVKRMLRQIYTPGTLLDGDMAVRRPGAQVPAATCR